jgi:thiol-disulfide isomerase/thioredoxin
MSNARRAKPRSTTSPGGRARRPSPGGGAGPGSGSKRWWMLGIAATVVLVVVVAIVVVALSGDDEPVVATAGGPREVAAVRIDSDGPLPPSTENGIIPTDTDVAVGMAIPRLVGLGFDGRQQRFAPNGKPAVYVFASHWCPACQTMIPQLQQWRDRGDLPAEVRWLTISTAANESQPNWPPSAWFASKGWNAPVILDNATNDAALAFGVGAFPYFIVTDGAGQVVQRAAGELTLEQLKGVLGPLVNG